MPPIQDIKQSLADKILESVEGLNGYDTFEGHTLEVSRTGHREATIRAKPARDEYAAPRYFRVVISEMM